MCREFPNLSLARPVGTRPGGEFSVFRWGQTGHLGHWEFHYACELSRALPEEKGETQHQHLNNYLPFYYMLQCQGPRTNHDIMSSSLT
jgi:hypothetical protein